LQKHINLFGLAAYELYHSWSSAVLFHIMPLSDTGFVATFYGVVMRATSDPLFMLLLCVVSLRLVHFHPEAP